MDQIKYLMSSTLILLFLAAGYFLFSNIVKEAPRSYSYPQVIDYDNDLPKTAFLNGQNLFAANCQACHSKFKTLSAPALNGVTERGPWADRKNIYKWIKNPAAFVSKTPYTKKLLAEYGYLMPAFPQLSEEDIDAILEYVNENVYTEPISAV